MEHRFRTMLIVFAALGMILSIGFCLIAMPGHSIVYIGLPFMDLLIAAILLALGLFLQSRFLAGVSVVTAFFTLLVKAGAIVLYIKSYLAVTYETLALLLEHTNHEGVKAMVGEYYLIWVPILCLALIGVLVYCIHVTANYIREVKSAKLSTEGNDKCKTYVLAFVALSLASNALYVYYHDVDNSVEENYVGHVIMPVHVLCGELYEDFSREQLHRGEQLQYGFNPTIEMSLDHRQMLKEMGLIPTEKTLCKYPTFEKIVVIAIESLDSDFIVASGNPKIPSDLTPNINRLQQEWFSFSNYWSSSQPTSWGLNSMILGRVDYTLDKRIKNVSLCDLMRKNGMSTYYISPIGGNFGDNNKVFQRIFRFDKMMFEEELRRDYPYVETAGGWGLSDESVYHVTLDFLRQKAHEKLFLLVSTMDSHNPYHTSGPTKKLQKYGVPFLDSIHGVDDNIGRFVKDFTSDPALFNDKTLLVVTADHSACHGLNYTTREYLPQSSRIPLIFIAKCDFAKYGFHNEKMFATTDFAADLALFAGAESVPDTFMGQPSVTKKDYAFTRDMQDIITLYLPDGKNISFDKMHPKLKTEGQQALYEYYRLYYSCMPLTEKQ